MKLYLNGILYDKERVTKPNSADPGTFTKLVLGASDELAPFVSESYEIQIDDFAIWLKSLSAAEIAYVMKESKETVYFLFFSLPLLVMRYLPSTRSLINQIIKLMGWIRTVKAFNVAHEGQTET